MNELLMDNSQNLEKRLKELEGKFERLKDITFNDLGEQQAEIWKLEDKLSSVKQGTQNNIHHLSPDNNSNTNAVNLTDLTNSEQKILEMKRKFMTQREIARQLGVTEAYVSTSLKKIRRKLSTQNL